MPISCPTRRSLASASPFCVAMLATSMLAPPVQAVFRSYDNGGGDADWFNPLNWDPDGGPDVFDTLSVTAGSPTASATVDVGDGGSILVDGASVGFGELRLADSGTAGLSVVNGGDVTTSGLVRIGVGADAVANVLLSGAGSTWVAAPSSFLSVGRGTFGVSNVTGTMTVSDQASLTGPSMDVGSMGGSTGQFNIDGATASFTGFITAGSFGKGTVDVTNGGLWETTGGNLEVGRRDTGVGVVNVDAGTVSVANQTAVGIDGRGSINVFNGGTLDAGSGTFFVGSNINGDGEVFVEGVGSTATTGAGLQIGNRGLGYMEVNAGGVVTSGSGFLGVFGIDSDGEAWIEGPGSTWMNTGQLSIGREGFGLLTISDGGSVTASFANVGEASTGEGTLDLFDGGALAVTSRLDVGDSGVGFLNAELGSTISSVGGSLGTDPSGEGEAFLADPGTNWAVNGDLRVGWQGFGLMFVVDGAQVSAANSFVGQGVSASGEVIVAGPDAKWTHTGDLTVGLSGEASLLVTEGGTVTSVNGKVGEFGEAFGGVAVGTLFALPPAEPAMTEPALSGELPLPLEATWALSGSLFIGSGDTSGLGEGFLSVLPDGVVAVGGDTVVRATGAIEMVGGLLHTGTLDVSSGELIFGDGTLTTQSVAGSIEQDGGVLAPGFMPANPGQRATGQTAISGDYTQQPDAALSIDLAGAGGVAGLDFDRLSVAGTATLGGLLSVDLLGAYAPSIGDSFVILEAATRIGTFAGLAEGDYVRTLGGRSLFVTYEAGDGNDVGLFFAIPSPGTAALMSLGLGACLMPRCRA